MREANPATRPKSVPWFFMAMKVIGESPHLGKSEKNILRVMLLWADKDTGELFPSVETIARHASMTAQGVRRVLRKLKRKGWVVVVKASKGGVRPNGRGIPNVYRLQLGGSLPPPTNAAPPEVPSGPTPRQSTPMNPNCGTGFSPTQPEPIGAKPETSQSSTPTVDAMNPNRGTGEPSIHPSNELNQSNPLPVAALSAARVGDQCDAVPCSPYSLHDALARCGINGRNLEDFAAAALTSEQVMHDYAQIKADRKVRNPPAVLAKRLGALTGIDVDRPDNEESRRAQRRELLRRQCAELKKAQ